jgi:hypothetical protein
MRSFKFFEMEGVKGPIDSLEITAACYGRSSLMFGDCDGIVCAIDRSAKAVQYTFQAYAGPVTHMKHLRTRNVLVTIGDDDAMNPSILRIWDLDRRDGGTGRPAQREQRLFGPKHPPPGETITLRTSFNNDVIQRLRFFGGSASAIEAGSSTTTGNSKAAIPLSDFKTCIVAFDVTEDLQHCAVGLTNGDVICIKGDLERERSPKIRRIHTSIAKERLTFVGFPRTKALEQQRNAGGGGGSLGLLSSSSASSAAFAQMIYTVHEDVTTVWRVTHKGEYTEYSCMPEIGAPYECSTITDEAQLVVGNAASNRIAIFGGEQLMQEMSRQWDAANLVATQWAEIEGDRTVFRLRKLLHHKSYVIVLQQNETRPERFQLQAYDVENSIRGLNRQQETHINVGWILTDLSEILIISQDPKAEVIAQKVARLTEVETQSKLEQLFSKECYDIAKKMAKRLQGDDKAQTMSIQKKYGDHLYAKGKFSEAIDQYIEAIGFLEPSYVIRQFLDAQRIGHLTRYLEELHHRKHNGIANKNHTTLLLNCYTKLRDEGKLNEFISRTDITFDAHNAIRVCRQAGYYEAATTLADKYHIPMEFVKIQLENLNNAPRALAFVRKLRVDQAEAILLARGKELMVKLPDETTDAVIELCTDWRSGGPRQRLDDTIAAAGASATKRGAHGGAAAPTQQAALPANRASAQDFISVFVDSPLCLLKFLRAVVDSGVLDTDRNNRRPGDDTEDTQRVVFNALIELFLTKDLKRSIKHVDPSAATTAASTAAVGIGGGGRSEYVAEPLSKRLERCMSLLDTHWGRYDPYHALALTQQHKFEEGTLFLLQRLNLFSEIFAHYAKQFEYGEDFATRTRAKKKLMQTCQENNTSNQDSDRELWISLLSLLVRSKDDVSQDVTQVLSHIEKEDILPPVAVIEILSANKNLQLRCVRDYVIRMLRKDAEKVTKHQENIKDAMERSAKLKSEVRDLTTSATIFQTNKCAHCSCLLDLPAVHFLCRHSFHQRCLNDVLECNVCAVEARRVMQVQRELDEMASNHDVFFQKVGSSNDPFSVVAEYFGKGIFAATQLRKDAVLAAGPATFDDADGDEDDEAEDAFEDGDDFYDDAELEDPESVEHW